MSLNAIARPAAREPGLLVILLLCLTVAKVDSIGFVTGMKRQASPVRWPPASGGAGLSGIRCDRPGQGRRE